MSADRDTSPWVVCRKDILHGILSWDVDGGPWSDDVRQGAANLVRHEAGHQIRARSPETLTQFRGRMAREAVRSHGRALEARHLLIGVAALVADETARRTSLEAR